MSLEAISGMMYFCAEVYEKHVMIACIMSIVNQHVCCCLTLNCSGIVNIDMQLL